MSLNRQPDLFLKDIQPDLLENQPAQAYRPEPDEVRRDLHRMLAEARAAKSMPWRPAIAKLYQTIFPQMSKWLPDEEAAQLRLEFATELDRLRTV